MKREYVIMLIEYFSDLFHLNTYLNQSLNLYQVAFFHFFLYPNIKSVFKRGQLCPYGSEKGLWKPMRVFACFYLSSVLVSFHDDVVPLDHEIPDWHLLLKSVSCSSWALASFVFTKSSS